MEYQGTDGVFLGSWKNIFVSVWQEQGTILAINRMLSAVAAMPRIAEKRSDIYVIAAGARLPDGKVRDYFVDAMASESESLAAVAVVVAGSGFWASALKSFVTGLYWLAPRSFDFRLRGSIEEVAIWLPPVHERLSGVHIEPSRLRRVLETWAAPRLRAPR